MTRPQNNEFQQLENFAVRLLEDFQNRIASGGLDKLSVEQAGQLVKMPYQLKQLLAGIKSKNQEKIAEVAQQLFIIACASQVPLEDVLKFKEDAKLDDKVLNDFGPGNKGELNPLAAALAGGRKAAELEQLIKAGADLNFRSPEGNNAAHFAVMLNVDAATLQLLIDHGVDINASNKFGLTPFDLALIKQAESGVESPLIEVLRVNKAEISMLADLAENQRSASGKGKVNVKTTDKRKNRSAIHDEEDEEKRAKKDRAVTVKTNPDIDERRRNLSPQANAALNFLANAGIDVEQLQDQRLIMQAALDEAVRRGSETLTLQLLMMGAEPSARTFELAFINHNMNLVCQLSMHADRGILQVVEIKAHQVFPEAEAFIHQVETHGSLVGAQNAVLAETRHEIEKVKEEQQHQVQVEQQKTQEVQRKQEEEKQQVAEKVAVDTAAKETSEVVVVEEERTFLGVISSIVGDIKEELASLASRVDLPREQSKDEVAQEPASQASEADVLPQPIDGGYIELDNAEEAPPEIDEEEKQPSQAVEPDDEGIDDEEQEEEELDSSDLTEEKVDEGIESTTKDATKADLEEYDPNDPRKLPDKESSKEKVV